MRANARATLFRDENRGDIGKCQSNSTEDERGNARLSGGPAGDGGQACVGGGGNAGERELSIIWAAGCGRYKIVVLNEAMYTTVVNGFLRDIARDDDYQIYAVNNWCDGLEKFGTVIEALCSPFTSGFGSMWLSIPLTGRCGCPSSGRWDDLEKFGAVNARFVATRHGMRFEVTLHTAGSWDAQATHSEYMRRKFDTVIKTDVLFCDDPARVERARSEMRREEMWRGASCGR
eukprot:COSAG01_NODE_3467_length_6056_cov_2.509820_6_plen_232_part_00